MSVFKIGLKHFTGPVREPETPHLKTIDETFVVRKPDPERIEVLTEKRVRIPIDEIRADWVKNVRRENSRNKLQALQMLGGSVEDLIGG